MISIEKVAPVPDSYFENRAKEEQKKKDEATESSDFRAIFIEEVRKLEEEKL